MTSWQTDTLIQEIRMPFTFHKLEQPTLTADRNLWCVPVPWGLVSVARGYLKARGCLTTLCLDPATREAHLVLWPGVDPRRTIDLLAQLTGERPTLRLVTAA
jgi:hypothetical protein